MTHIPHPHIAARKAAGPPRVADQGSRLARRITAAVGTMYCAYAFSALALVSLPAAVASRSVIIIVSWVAQTFLQLVLLSVIMVGQNAAAAASDRRAEMTYLDAEAILHEISGLRALMSTEGGERPSGS